jgi:serine/threonine protein kinase
MMHLLAYATKARGCVPRGLALGEDLDLPPNPSCTGMFSDVYKTQYVGVDVASKRLRRTFDPSPPSTPEFEFPHEYFSDLPDKEQIKQAIYSTVLWRQLEHPNLVKLIGTHADEVGGLSLVLPWASRGDLSQYIKSPHYKADTDLLRLVSDTKIMLRFDDLVLSSLRKSALVSHTFIARVLCMAICNL